MYELYGKKVIRKINSVKERKEICKKKLNDLKHRCHIIKSYSKDPLLCRCGELMLYAYSYDSFDGGMINDR